MTSRITCILFLLALCSSASAEPYLAVLKGMKCSQCHSHPSGGGKRNVYGNVFAQTELAERRIGDSSASLWTGEVFSWLSVGANARADYESVDVPGSASDSDFDITRATVYVEASLVPERLSIYLDEKVAPDDVDEREWYLKLKTRDSKYFVAAGQFFLPYGLRLEDDSAFIRQATGVNFIQPDRGVQAGFESGPWSTQLSLTNGTGRGSVFDSTDRVSFVGQYVTRQWRAGASFNSTDSAAGDRRMFNVFGGLKTGSVAWLAEIDLISDDVPGASSVDAIAGLVEANWNYRQGHNLKISYEYLDPNDDISENHQVRWSLLWEYAPIQFVQARVGARLYDGIPQVPFQDRDELFLQLHVFF
ncbi:MAG: hypothetical protein R3192_10830 [Woeseiaceae bacterium]|nr:hypothetical protein [Woeseiaceae bacterium]